MTILQHKLAEAALAFRNTVAGLTHWQGTMKAVHFQSSEQHCVLRWMPSKECDVGWAFSCKGPRSFSLQVTKMGADPWYKMCPV